MTAHKGPILLFDGVCNLCNCAVQFILKRDPKGQFRFASLQSDIGAELLAKHGREPDDFSSIVLIEDSLCLTRSDAALAIASRLSGAWPVLGIFKIIPRPIRDGIYDLIARNRYRWFGKRDQCVTQTGDKADRFLS